MRRIETALTGRALLSDPVHTKGTAFSAEERIMFGLEGLLPARVETIDVQIERIADKYNRLHDDLERHIFLRSLQDTNEVLCFRFLAEHLETTLPIVYTPTVGDACEQFSHIYRRPHGLFLSWPERHQMTTALAAVDRDVNIVVVTDGERILGLGDQGIGGMGIPIGKLELYTVAGGIDPLRTLPILLDVGTDNEDLLADPLYLGWRHERVRGGDYDSFVEQFVEALGSRFPGVLLQWEDFAQANATPLLERYRKRICSFNDDIQGTAAVALAAVSAAVTAVGATWADQRIVIAGAGSAGTGIASMLAATPELAEASHDEHRLFLTDAGGLLHDRRTDLLSFQKPLATPWSAVSAWADSDGPTSLASVVEAVHPTVLIGVSGQGGLFDEPLITAMAAGVERPIVLPLSNPTSKAEATPADVLAWTNGRALVATGSPFDDVIHDGTRHRISQSNNVYVFPGVGLGVLVAQASEVTDTMLRAAATAVADHSPCRDADATAGVLPALEEVPTVSRRIAAAVARAARDEGVAAEIDDDEIGSRIEATWWHPEYPELVRQR